MKLSMRLDTSDIDDAIKTLELYRDTLYFKCETFVKRLAEIGANVAMMTLAHDGFGDAPRDADFAINADSYGNLVKGQLTVQGEGILFWEFGAGNEYNGMTSPNPKAGDFGMGPGTYPGQTHVPDPGYWYYRDGNGLQKSYGTQATMPMYKASLEMIERMEEIAKEVFSGQ